MFDVDLIIAGAYCFAALVLSYGVTVRHLPYHRPERKRAEYLEIVALIFLAWGYSLPAISDLLHSLSPVVQHFADSLIAFLSAA